MSPFASYDDISLASFSVKSDGKTPIKTLAMDFETRSTTRIGFKGENVVKEFEMIDDEVKHEIWYTADEYDIIKARNALIVKMMKAGTFEESEEHSFRGLEHKLRDGHKQRRANKFNGLNCVLEEQDRQQSRGRRDDVAIADIYRRIAQNAKENSFVIGIKDSEQSYAYIQPPPSVFRLPQENVLQADFYVPTTAIPNIEDDYDCLTDTPSIQGSLSTSSFNKKSTKSKFKNFFKLATFKNKMVKDTEHVIPTPTPKKRIARRASM